MPVAANETTPVDPLWYKDAVIYQLHVKTFHDSNGDGIGDFRGLIEKLDYLQELGTTAIWILPFYPSPLKDDGYDIADYYGVNPNYGTLQDFQAFLAAAHERGLKVITELVINHSSDQNPWFQKSRRAAPGSPEREMYVWSDTPDKYTRRASSSKTSRRRIGRGIRSRKRTTGIASIRISRI
jgi:maltose alpha-D-glucosyltransferase/alpha-amylase